MDDTLCVFDCVRGLLAGRLAPALLSDWLGWWLFAIAGFAFGLWAGLGGVMGLGGGLLCFGIGWEGKFGRWRVLSWKCHEM